MNDPFHVASCRFIVRTVLMQAEFVVVSGSYCYLGWSATKIVAGVVLARDVDARWIL